MGEVNTDLYFNSFNPEVWEEIEQEFNTLDEDGNEVTTTVTVDPKAQAVEPLEKLFKYITIPIEDIGAGTSFTDEGNGLILCTGTSTVILPEAKDGIILIFKRDGDGGTTTIEAAAGEAIDGSSTLAINGAWQSETIIGQTGVGWYII